MCYNLKVTMMSIFMHIVCSILLYRMGDWYKSAAVVLMGIGSMQLAELFIHLDKDATKKFPNGMNINRFGSLFGRFSLDVIQPIFSLFAILMLNIDQKLKRNLCAIWFLLFFTKIILVLLDFPSDEKLKTTKKQDCNIQNKSKCLLDWPWEKYYSRLNWVIYIILVVGLWAIAKKQTTFWILFGLMHVILGALTDHKIIRFWNASGSCLWGPFLGYIILATGLFKKVPELPIFDKLRELLSKK